jgi:hypothetical protein
MWLTPHLMLAPMKDEFVKRVPLVPRALPSGEVHLFASLTRSLPVIERGIGLRYEAIPV